MRDINKKILKMQYKKSISQYLNHVYSSEKYKNYLTDLKKDENSNIWDVEVFDVVDNDGMNKLVSSLYKLNSYKFEVQNYLKKPFATNLSYVQMQINGTGIGVLAKIKLKEDKFIDEINLSYTQINNQQIIICYKFFLRKPLDSLGEKEFIRMNIDKTYKGYYQSIYRIKQLIEDDSLYKQSIQQMEETFLRDIFQSYIVNNFFTTVGEKYKLPILFYVNYNNIDNFDKTIKEAFLLNVFYNKKKDYFLIFNDIERERSLEIYVYFKTRTMPNSNFLDYFRQLGNEFYYFIFENIECIELNSKIGKYLNNKNKIIKEKDCRWIINKLRAIKDTELKKVNFDEENMWECYDKGKIVDRKFINYPQYVNKFNKIYEEYFQYVNNIFSSKNNSLVLKVTIIALIIAIISVIISFISLLKNQ